MKKTKDVNKPFCSNFHTLEKMKKMILEEKMKTVNRIRLYKKTSNKLFRQKQKEKEIELKRESLKKESLFMKSRKGIQFAGHSEPSKKLQKSLRSLGQIIVNEKEKDSSWWTKIQSRKQDKQRNQMLIKKIKEKQRRKKLKSANVVRQGKEKMKVSRQKFFENRIETVRAEYREKIEKQQKQYEEVFTNLRNLKSEENRALKEWKNVYEARNQ